MMMYSGRKRWMRGEEEQEIREGRGETGGEIISNVKPGPVIKWHLYMDECPVPDNLSIGNP